jgi:TetR/AcrR family transcriptional regulator
MPAKPGERRLQILQTLAQMLESPEPEKITTAALAARLEVSEAALYRHFASKAQMFEGLIEFIEHTVFGLINQITTDKKDGLEQVEAIGAMLLAFAQKNPGMTRVLIGEVLVNEHARLQARINQLHDRIETTLRQALRIAQTEGKLPREDDVAAQANALMAFIVGRWHQYAKSGFRRDPGEYWAAQRAVLLAR